MTGDPGSDEQALAARVVSVLLRENYGGLAGRVSRDGGRVTLRLPVAERRDLVVPLEPDGFLADLRVPAGTPLTLDHVRSAAAELAGPRDAAGAAVFDAECRQALAESRLRACRLAAARVGQLPGQRCRVSAWLGPAGQISFDALAAGLPHPAYPASPCRMGFTDEDLLGYAPEFRPEFDLRWAAVRKEAVTWGGRWRADWWPELAMVGLPAGLAATHDLFPVHPLAARTLPAALRGIEPPVLLAPRPYLRVRPTLSVRTVAVRHYQAEHVKLPLPISTLGMRNLRSIAPVTLADGALVCRILTRARAADPRLERMLVADDTGYAHAGHPNLGYLLRRLPAGLDGSQVVPVAALAARVPGGRPVIEELAGPDGVLGYAAAYFRLVFGIAVRLLVRYGVALESHQQNAALVASPGRPLRLLVKDFDGALISLPRLHSALGPVPAASAFADPRLLTGSDDALADMFVTITVHLCVGAVAFALAEQGVAPLRDLLAAAREALEGALDAERGQPPAALLRARVLEAARLPGKSMVTAGTLTAKEHTGAADVNKFYGTTGPNYLREAR